MKIRRSRALGFFVLVAGCAGPGSAPQDSGLHDLSRGAGDLAARDLSGSDAGGDLGASDLGGGDLGTGCVQVPTWPGLQPVAAFDTTQGDTFVVSSRQTMEPQDVLAVEDWHSSAGNDGGESYPKMHQFSSQDNYISCELCVRLYEGCTAASGCTRGFFVQGGSLTVTRADTDPNVGRMTLSGTNLRLVEWQFPTLADGGVVGDQPVAGGRCWQIGSVALDVPWNNTSDGGVDASSGPDLGAGDLARSDLALGDLALPTPDLAGVACHPVINEFMTGSALSASDEFIELYNPCPTPVDLSAWKLVYRSAGNNSGKADLTLATFPAGTTLAAGGYRVGVNQLQPQRTHDFTYSGGLAGTGGAVGLRNAAAVRVDSVAYQTLTTANNLTEGSPAPNPPLGASIGRLPNGVDTDDNSRDFRGTTILTPGSANQ